MPEALTKEMLDRYVEEVHAYRPRPYMFYIGNCGKMFAFKPGRPWQVLYEDNWYPCSMIFFKPR